MSNRGYCGYYPKKYKEDCCCEEKCCKPCCRPCKKKTEWKCCGYVYYPVYCRVEYKYGEECYEKCDYCREEYKHC